MPREHADEARSIRSAALRHCLADSPYGSVASVRARGLEQSYERTMPFAGKLNEGPFTQGDWGPIPLSDSLLDTEFGALLNITDQILKSRSTAGQIDYLYFDYPLRPAAGQFVFGSEPISSILRRETGSQQTHYNWNTSGAASLVSSGEVNVLVPGRT